MPLFTIYICPLISYIPHRLGGIRQDAIIFTKAKTEKPLPQARKKRKSVSLKRNIRTKSRILFSMMNYIFTAAILISVIFSLTGGTVSVLSQGILDGAANAVSICMKLLSVMALWNGLAAIAEDSGLLRTAQRLLSPVVGLLFPKYSKTEAASAISANITANLMGLGNAATPLGIEAMRRMRECAEGDTADNEMVRFVVLNSAALTLIPSTVAALRLSSGSGEPFSIIIPVWLTGITALTAGLTAERLLSRITKRK